MNATDLKIGLEVVRSKGDYVVGRVGNIIEIIGNKAKIHWNGAAVSTVDCGSLEPTSIPYKILPYSEKKDNRGFLKLTWPKYQKL